LGRRRRLGYAGGRFCCQVERDEAEAESAHGSGSKCQTQGPPQRPHFFFPLKLKLNHKVKLRGLEHYLIFLLCQKWHIFIIIFF
jgi:hypothetical protein